MEAALALIESERGKDFPIRGSMMKQTMQKRNPGFNERAHGFKSFRELLKAAERKGIPKIEVDEKSGDYRVCSIE